VLKLPGVIWTNVCGGGGRLREPPDEIYVSTRKNSHGDCVSFSGKGQDDRGSSRGKASVGSERTWKSDTRGRWPLPNKFGATPFWFWAIGPRVCLDCMQIYANRGSRATWARYSPSFASHLHIRARVENDWVIQWKFPLERILWTVTIVGYTVINTLR